MSSLPSATPSSNVLPRLPGRSASVPSLQIPRCHDDATAASSASPQSGACLARSVLPVMGPASATAQARTRDLVFLVVAGPRPARWRGVTFFMPQENPIGEYLPPPRQLIPPQD